MYFFEIGPVLTDLALCFRYAENAMINRLAVVASILRLGTKYNVAYFRQIAVARLIQAIPTTLDQYTNLVQEDDTPVFGGQENQQTMLVVLHLARECNVPAVLPCCLWYWTPVAGRYNQENYPGKDNSSFITEDGRVYALDFETYSLCLAAGWRMDDYRRKLLLTALINCREEYECESCLSNVSETLSAIDRSFFIFLENIDLTRWANDFRLCDDCAECAGNEWDRGRKVSWDTLPSYYGLASWHELLAASTPVSGS
jgi:hypothetical protein